MTDTFMNSWFPGLQAMANVHPIVVHFPIALLTSYLVVAVLALFLRSESLRHAASWMLYFGTLGAAAAVVAGYRAAATVEHSEEVHVLLEQHETYGLVVLVLAVLLAMIRRVVGQCQSRLVRWTELLLAALLVAIMSRGADLGGLMVYGHAVAVRQSCDPVGEPTSTEVPAAPATAVTEPPGRPPASPPRHAHPHPHKHLHDPHP